ncbi:MAG: LysR family transcriptional regulator [Clostridia bacterium]|nr:LysR family transcriptional regulator [Clostridia bacterium]
MNTTHLKYFLEVADAANITHAAEKLYISQQALSNQIQKLEKSLGVMLFERKPALTLTYAGSRLYAYAKEMLEREAALQKELEEIGEGVRGSVTVGISYTRGRVFLPLVLPEFHENFPNVEIKLHEGNSAQLKEELENGTVDIVIAADRFSKAEFETEALMTERLYWCGNPQFMESVKKGNLSDIPFVLMIKENRIRMIIDSLFARQGITPNIVTESDNIETVLSLAAEGMGVTVYPAQFLENRKKTVGENDSLCYHPVGDSTTDTVLVAAWKKGRYMSRFERAFIDICRKKAGK